MRLSNQPRVLKILKPPLEIVGSDAQVQWFLNMSLINETERDATYWSQHLQIQGGGGSPMRDWVSPFTLHLVTNRFARSCLNLQIPSLNLQGFLLFLSHNNHANHQITYWALPPNNIEFAISPRLKVYLHSQSQSATVIGQMVSCKRT